MAPSDLAGSGDDLRNGAVTTVAETDGELPTSLITDGTYAYWSADRSIWRAPVSGKGPTTKLVANVLPVYKGHAFATAGAGKLIVPGMNDLQVVTVDPNNAAKWKTSSLGDVILDYPGNGSIHNVEYADGYIYFVINIGETGDVFRVKADGKGLENLSAWNGKPYIESPERIAATSAGVFWTTYSPGINFKANGSKKVVTIKAAHRAATRMVASGTTAFWIAGDGFSIGTVDPQTSEVSSRAFGDPKVNPPTSTAVAVDDKRVYWMSRGNIMAAKWPSGSEPIVLAKGQEDAVIDIAVDDQNVYWSIALSEKKGIIRSVKKPQEHRPSPERE